MDDDKHMNQHIVTMLWWRAMLPLCILPRLIFGSYALACYAVQKWILPVPVSMPSLSFIRLHLMLMLPSPPQYRSIFTDPSLTIQLAPEMDSMSTSSEWILPIDLPNMIMLLRDTEELLIERELDVIAFLESKCRQTMFPYCTVNEGIEMVPLLLVRLKFSVLMSPRVRLWFSPVIQKAKGLDLNFLPTGVATCYTLPLTNPLSVQSSGILSVALMSSPALASSSLSSKKETPPSSKSVKLRTPERPSMSSSEQSSQMVSTVIAYSRLVRQRCSSPP